jgi:hypothetical protein
LVIIIYFSTLYNQPTTMKISKHVCPTCNGNEFQVTNGMRNPRKQMLRCVKGCRKRFGLAEASRAYRYLNRESDQGFGGDEHEGSAQFGDAMSDVVVDAVLSPVLDTGLHAELPSPSNTDADVASIKFRA